MSHNNIDNFESNDFEYLRSKQDDDDYWEERIRRRDIASQSLYHPQRMKNNPNAKPCGHFTGRCGKCGSSNLWDDNSAYGCNDCGAFWTF